MGRRASMFLRLVREEWRSDTPWESMDTSRPNRSWVALVLVVWVG